MVRKARLRGVALELARPGGDVHRVGTGERVRVSGPVGELVLELYGRRSVAEVDYDGDDDAVARVRAANFGI